MITEMFLNKFKIPRTRPGTLAGAYALLCLLLPTVVLFNARAVVPIAIVVALAVLLICWRKGQLGDLQRMDKPLVVLTCGYFAATLIASLNAGIESDAIVSTGKLAGIIVLAAILIPAQTSLSHSDRQWVFLTLIVSVSLATFWILFDVWSTAKLSWLIHGYDTRDPATVARLKMYGYFWYKSALAMLVLLALILGIYLQKHGSVLIAFFFVAVTALAGLEIGSRTAGFGILLALAIGSTYHLFGSYRRKLAIALLLLSFLTPLWVPSIGIKPSDVSAELNDKYGYANSIVYRLHIWDFVTGKIYEKPLLGWGAGASKRLGTEDQGILSDPNFGPLGEAIPIHPHNGILQIWLEFGALGALFAFSCVSRFLIIMDRRLNTPGSRIWGFSAAGLLACFFGFNFSISSSWWLTSVVFCIAIAALFSTCNEKSAEP